MQDQTDNYDGAFIKTLYFVIYENRLYWFMHYKTWGLDKHITIKRWVQEYNGTNIYTSLLDIIFKTLNIRAIFGCSMI